MGRRDDGQDQFFYSFDLDKVVPPDHLVRQIDAVLDLSWVHKELAPYYSHTGRPSIDPALMNRMLIVGYVFAIRSERRLCSLSFSQSLVQKSQVRSPSFARATPTTKRVCGGAISFGGWRQVTDAIVGINLTLAACDKRNFYAGGNHGTMIVFTS
jgi:hypothetical protein